MMTLRSGAEPDAATATGADLTGAGALGMRSVAFMTGSVLKLVTAAGTTGGAVEIGAGAANMGCGVGAA